MTDNAWKCLSPAGTSHFAAFRDLSAFDCYDIREPYTTVRLSSAEALAFARQLPEVQALVASHKDLLDMVEWMSGAPAFGPEGEAHKGWIKMRSRIQAGIVAQAPFREPADD